MDSHKDWRRGKKARQWLSTPRKKRKVPKKNKNIDSAAPTTSQSQNISHDGNSGVSVEPPAEVQTSAETEDTQETNDGALRQPSAEQLETLVVKVEYDDSYEDTLHSSQHDATQESDMSDAWLDDASAPNPSTSATVTAPRPAKRGTEKTQSRPQKKSSRVEELKEVRRLRAEQLKKMSELRILEQRKKAAAQKRKKEEEARRREAPWQGQRRLIAAVRERPLLYLRAAPLPPGQPPAAALQARQWREIADELHKPVEWVQSEWRALCRAYHRRLLAAAGDEDAAAALPEWRFDEQMSFFRKHMLDGDMDSYVGGTAAAGAQTEPAAPLDAYEAQFARLRPAYARLPQHDREHFLAQCEDNLNELVENDRMWNAEVSATK